MKKLKLFLTLLIVASFCKITAQDTINIATHNQVFINTNVKQGTNSFFGWGKFPDNNQDIRRIKMQVTLAHPDTAGIAHWDYLDFIYLRRTGGKSGASQDIELGRLITPYGSNFTKDWKFTWEVDVTDFASLLQDSVEVEYIHAGYEPEKLGWKLTVNFEVHKGPAIANPISITELYKGEFPYGDKDDPVENYLKPVTFSFENNADLGRIRIQHTGHGFGAPDYCSEFCTRWREVLFNNKVIDKRDLWKDCGSNPLYPQGGTWLYDRAHWCPGDLQPADTYDLQAIHNQNTIDIDMMPYVDSIGKVEGREIVTAYLIQYSSPNRQYDVVIEDIEVPSNNALYSRQNPAVFNPVIRFRNIGSETLTRLKIIYGTSGFKTKTFKWEGSLEFNEETTVKLPGKVDFHQDKNTFKVVLEKPNGKKDQWAFDNKLTSAFEAPKNLPLDFIVSYRSNKKPQENNLFIVNEERDTVYQRKPENCEPSTLYEDTIHLAPGVYEFELTDSAGNGLEFWAEPQHGYGYLRIHNMESNILHQFISDCGNGQFLAFQTKEGVQPDSTVSQNSFFIYPRRTKDNLKLDAFLESPKKLRVQFMADGEPIEVHEYNNFRRGTLDYYIGYLPKGRYVVEVFVDNKLVHKNRINRD